MPTLDAPTRKSIRLSRWQLDVFCKCPRCFWLLKRHNIKPPETFPLSLNNCIDALLKAEFDEYRRAGQLPPLLAEAGLTGRLFRDTFRLEEWRTNFQGLRWTDPGTGHVLFGAIDDLLEFPDGSMAVIDYKSSGAAAPYVHESYQLQMDVYTHLLQRLGFKTEGRAFFAFFVAARDQGFRGRLPFRGTLLEVATNPDRVPPLFAQALVVAQSDQLPDAGARCDQCRWAREALPVLQPAPAPRVERQGEFGFA